MASSVLNRLRGKRQAGGMPADEVQRQIALTLSLARRQARAEQDNAVAAAVVEVVQAIGIDVAKEVSTND